MCKTRSDHLGPEFGQKSLVMLERPLLTLGIKETHLQRCQALLNNLKSAKANWVIIFSDEKTWTVDQVRNSQNDRFMAFGDINDEDRTITTTKHPASVMSLGFMALNSMAAPLIWFPAGSGSQRPTASRSWSPTSWHGSGPTSQMEMVVLQQDLAPAHTAKKSQEFLKANMDFWSKDMWHPYSPDANPLDFAFWSHIEAKDCTDGHPNIEALNTPDNAQWAAMTMEYICKSCSAFRKHIEMWPRPTIIRKIRALNLYVNTH